MFWALPWRAGPLALSTRDASRSFKLALPATAQGKRRASPIDPEPNAAAMLA